MGDDSSTSALVERLRALDGIDVSSEHAAIDAAGRDFGGITGGRARAVAKPRHADALCGLLEFAIPERLPLTPRTLGYSQSGQSIPRDGVSVDLRAFDTVDIDPERRQARCGAAVPWRALLAAAAAHGLAPKVMPFNLDISIGGTLSAGGIGSTSHHHGMAVSWVDELEVVTGTGQRIRASRSEHREVYDAVLGGLGLFGFICEATLALRPMLPVTRTYSLLYDDLATMMADELTLMGNSACVHLEGFASAAVQGVRRGPGGRRSPFARWFGGMHLSLEREPDDECGDALLDGLHHREQVHVEETDSLEFAARYDIRFEVMRATGAWQQPHPWFECMVARDAAMELLPTLVPQLPLLLGDGHRIMPFADVDRPPFVMQPSPSPCFGLAMLPMGIAPPFLPPVLAALRGLHDRLVERGGKRYLSGWLFEPDETAWRRHFGPQFETWQARRQQLDPHGLLGSMLLPPRATA